MAEDFYKYFRIEARELLEQLVKGVLLLEKQATPAEIAQVLRWAHTLKGAARVVKLPEIADDAHRFEDVLSPFREAAEALPRHHIDALFGLLDGIGARLNLLFGDPREAGAGSPPVEPLRLAREDVAEMDQVLAGITEARGQLGSMHRTRLRAQRASRTTDLLADRLSAAKLRDELRTGEALSETCLLVDELKTWMSTLERDLASSIDLVDRELAQVRESVERLRLLPVGVLFTALERSARDTAQELGKQVAFEGHAHDIRLDAHVLSEVNGALLQLVRNAVAHGIEVPAKRRSVGKKAEGRIRIDVTRRASEVIFAFSDDGGGIDIDAVREHALRKGLLAREPALDDQQLLHLLLRGGISTSPSVTEFSGRGVGLDVAREAVERLRGRVSLHSKAGHGTTVELVVPVSLASLEALLFESSGVTMALPLEAIRATLRATTADIGPSDVGQSIVHDGKVIAFAPLDDLLGRKSPRARTLGAWSAVVVETKRGIAALGVDRLLGTTRILVRPLPELPLTSTTMVAGASLDADGDPQLVLDPEGLVAATMRTALREPDARPSKRVILVIDDSLTTRMLEQSILESAGYEVDLATSGEEGLEKALAKPYALCLVDVEMPGMDGFTFVERCGDDPRLAHLPCILVTSRSSSEDLRRGQEVGAKSYVVKSEFDQGALLERICQLVGEP